MQEITRDNKKAQTDSIRWFLAIFLLCFLSMKWHLKLFCFPNRFNLNKSQSKAFTLHAFYVQQQQQRHDTNGVFYLKKKRLELTSL